MRLELPVVFELLEPRDRLWIGALVAMSFGAALLEMVSVAMTAALVVRLGGATGLASGVFDLLVAQMQALVPVSSALVAGCLAVGAVFLVKNVYLLAHTWLRGRWLSMRSAALAARLFRGYVTGPYEATLGRDPSQLIANVNEHAHAILPRRLVPWLDLANEVLLLLVLLAFLFWQAPLITLGVLVVLGLSGAATWRWVLRSSRRLGRVRFELYAELHRKVSEALRAMREIRLYGRGDAIAADYDRAAGPFAAAGAAGSLIGHAPIPIAETIVIAGLIVVAVAAQAQGLSDPQALALLAMYAVAGTRLLPSFRRVVSALHTLGLGSSAAKAVTSELRRMGQPTGSAVPASAPVRVSIRAEGVRYRFPGAATPALDGVDLEIRRGEWLALVGRSGAGKSTLVDVILGLLTPEAGRVLADGAPWRPGSEGVGYVPQDVTLIDGTIVENVRFHRRADDAEIAAVIELAGLAPVLAELPEGDGTLVGSRGRGLSGGQRQRVGIARALLRARDLLVLDEASAALDQELEAQLFARLRRARPALSVLLVTHRLTAARRCDRVAVLDAGRIVGDGPFAATLASSDILRRLDLVEHADGGAAR